MRPRVFGSTLAAMAIAIGMIGFALPGGRGVPVATPTPTATAVACDRSATTSTFATELDAATTGQRLCLATGNYGTFTGTNKAVTIAAAPSATVQMAVDLNSGDANFTLDGLQGMGGNMVGTVQNITIKNSAFASRIYIAHTVPSAGITLDNNTHIGITNGTSDVAGRIQIESDAVPCGVTIKNSLLQEGYSDGIRPGCDGAIIERNRFINFQDAEPYHADPIQSFGSPNTIIRFNYFDNGTGTLPNSSVAALIQVTNGAVGLRIHDNVFRAGGATDAINLGADSDVNPSILDHNVFESANGARTCPSGYQQRCGLIYTTDAETTIRSNIFNLQPTGAAAFNMIQAGTVSGSNFLGTPTFVGGSSPTDYAGFCLAIGSAGKGQGHDGLDVGIRC